jgi:hypothetical protein
MASVELSKSERFDWWMSGYFSKTVNYDASLWNHIAITMKGGSGRGYLNGEEFTTFTSNDKKILLVIDFILEDEFFWKSLNG